jgi:predicted transcriptional regulator
LRHKRTTRWSWRRRRPCRRPSAARLDGATEAAIVVDGSHICGLLTADGVARALGHDVARTPARAIADPTVPVIRADESLAEARQRMRAEEQPLAIVVDDRRRVVGLLCDHEAAS